MINLDKVTAQEREDWIFEEGVSEREIERRIMACHTYIFGINPLHIVGKKGFVYLPRQDCTCMEALTCNCNDKKSVAASFFDLNQFSFIVKSAIFIGVDDCSRLEIDLDSPPIECRIAGRTQLSSVSSLSTNHISWRNNRGEYYWEMQIKVEIGKEVHYFKPEFEMETDRRTGF